MKTIIFIKIKLYSKIISTKLFDLLSIPLKFLTVDHINNLRTSINKLLKEDDFYIRENEKIIKNMTNE